VSSADRRAADRPRSTPEAESSWLLVPLDDLRAWIRRHLRKRHPRQGRGVGYDAIAAGLVIKTDRTFINMNWHLTQMRRRGEIPWDWIEDTSRAIQKDAAWQGAMGLLDTAVGIWRKDPWPDQPFFVVILLEKEGLAATLREVCDEYVVPLLPLSGFSSVDFIFRCAQLIREYCEVEVEDEVTGEVKLGVKPCFVYAFVDHDGAGSKMLGPVERDLRDHLAGAGIPLHFERAAVTEAQIEDWDLPDRPPKVCKNTGQPESHNKHFDGLCVELDAIDPDRLQGLVRECIKRHLDDDATRQTERDETTIGGELRAMVDAVQRWTDAGRSLPELVELIDAELDAGT
jgi:hypothetical protein